MSIRLTPLTESTYYILLALTESLHGYGIIKRVEKLTNGRLVLAAGTLYGALQNLQKHKLITLISSEEEKKGKKIYAITSEGKELMEHELARLKEMVTNGEASSYGRNS